MFLNILVLLALALAVVFFGWLVTRAWKSRRWFIKWPGSVLGGLLALALALVSAVGAMGFIKMYSPSGQPAPQIQVDRTPERIQRGEHIADVFCVECHSPTGEKPMVGGRDVSTDFPIPVGQMISGNLTPGGPLKDWTDGEIMRALREGVDPQGRRLVVMKSIYARYLSDEDLHSLIAYLRSQPAVEQEHRHPLDRPNLLGLLVFGAGMVPDLPPVTGEIVAPPKAATAEYGQYILSYQDCRSCHGDNLNGGTSSIGPAGPPLRSVMGWTQEQFIATMRTGVNPGGHHLQPPMPWKAIARMDNEELQAMYLYITSQY